MKVHEDSCSCWTASVLLKAAWRMRQGRRVMLRRMAQDTGPQDNWHYSARDGSPSISNCASTEGNNKRSSRHLPVVVDEEARAKLHAFEERIAGAEGKCEGSAGAREESPRNCASGPGYRGGGASLAAGVNADLRIKSVDGQDVSALITQLVDNAVSRIEKDGIAKADFAMHSAGARVIPSLTSPDLELRAKGLGSQIAGLFTGKGYFGFLPPITALHHDTHLGAAGRLQVPRASWASCSLRLRTSRRSRSTTSRRMSRLTWRPHRSAWKCGALSRARTTSSGTTRGKAAQAARKEAGEQDEDEAKCPETLPTDVDYIRLAQFEYNIEAANHVQTFPVDPEIRNLGIDFGVVVLRNTRQLGVARSIRVCTVSACMAKRWAPSRCRIRRTHRAGHS